VPSAVDRFVPAPPETTSPELFRKLLWLNGVRLATGTALLIATAVLEFGDGTEGFPGRAEAALYGIIASIYLGSLVSVAILRSGRFLRRLAQAQVLGDLIAASGLVYLTGGADSVFTILYPLAIVNAAIGLYRRGALQTATLAAIAFCVLAIGMERGIITPPLALIDRAPLSTPRLLLTLAANVSAFFLTAMLTAYLATALQGARKELAKRETELKGLEELHRSIVESVASGILTTDVQGRVTYLNGAAARLTGLSLKDVRGSPLANTLPALSADHGEAVFGPRVVGYSAASLTMEEGGRVIVLQDLTELRRMEDEVRRADRLAALGKLSAGLAHEIRNPLASMCGSVALLGRSPGLAEKERRLLEIVFREGERLEKLVREFLAFARPAEPRMVPIELGQLLDETLSVFRLDAKAAQLTVANEPPQLFVTVLGDAGQLRQVLWNLLSNAAEAAGTGGTVRARLRRADSMAVMEVEDTGPGIPADDLERIFDPFFTTKESGTGLGLAIVHRIVEAHGGQLSVSSEPGKTRFSIALPEVASGSRAASAA
jgi:two-component system sensor histidine kinase PilS (NtrC family)